MRSIIARGDYAVGVVVVCAVSWGRIADALFIYLFIFRYVSYVCMLCSLWLNT